MTFLNNKNANFSGILEDFPALLNSFDFTLTSNVIYHSTALQSYKVMVDRLYFHMFRP